MSVESSVWSGLIPREVTQSSQFLTANPNFDGRGIIVGILDTGVDPGAIGLQITTDGKPKVIDIIDCTGSGDVTMGLPQEAKDGELEGVSGRKLMVNPAWTNPTGKFRTGMKRAFELYPNWLKTRVQKERKEKWMLAHKIEQKKMHQALAVAAGKENIEDCKARIAQLDAFEKTLEDPGPLLDCVTYHDGDRWQAIVDTTEEGDLCAVEPMTDYRVALQFRRFSSMDNFNFCVNIYDDGQILSICVDAGAHGSHVAGIVSAHHPDDLTQNGVAPGAQIVALKIGDSRLGSMETGVGMIRALTEAVKRGCHVINMSYGEAASWDNEGVIVTLAAELVHKHKICFMGSAGNNGPAISTVGAPCGTSASIISVGAYVSQSIMKTGYAMHQDVPETTYTWSSVGPALDGANGVSILCPGGAVTSVPNWTLAKNQLMNGTSMSAPNATGCIALLLSASKASLGELPHPVLMRRAVENTALAVDSVDSLGQGHGLLQVEKAWEYLQQHRMHMAREVRFDVKVNSERFTRGIYLRQQHEARIKNTFSVTVDAVFVPETEPEVKVHFEQRLVLRASADWVTCPSYVEMASSGKTFNVTVDPRGLPSNCVHTAHVRAYDSSNEDAGFLFEIPVTVVRPVIIPSGMTTVHLPLLDNITPTGALCGAVLHFSAAQRMRNFLVPPPGCTSIEAIVTDCRDSSLGGGGLQAMPAEGEADTPVSLVSDNGSIGDCKSDSSSRMVVLHALQTQRGSPYNTHEKQSYLNLTPRSTHTVSWNVVEGVTMELCLARFWSTLGDDTAFTVQLFFRGVTPLPSELHIFAGQRVSDEIRVHATLCLTDVAPSAKLDKWVHVVKPSAEGKVLPMGERDELSDGTPLYQLVLEYAFDSTDDDTTITPRFPALQGVLYESLFHSQFFMVYDSKKKLLGVGDAWPGKIKISIGKHVVRLQVRHESLAILQGLKDTPMRLERPMKKAVDLAVFKSQAAAAVNKGPKTAAVAYGSSVGFFFREPSFDSLPKGAAPGDQLVGNLTLCSESNGNGNSKSTVQRKYKCSYTCGDTKVPAPAVAKAGGEKTAGDAAESKSEDKDKDKGDNTKEGETGEGAMKAAKDDKAVTAMKEAVRDSMVKHLKTLVGTTDFDLVLPLVLSDHPTHLPLLLVILTHSEKMATTKSKVEVVEGKTEDTNQVARDGWRAVTTHAAAVLAQVDRDEIAKGLGTNLDKDDATAVAVRKDIDAQKTGLIAALVSQARALLELLKLVDMDATDLAQETATKLKAEVEGVFKEMQRWDDLSVEKHWFLYVSRQKLAGRWGLALKRVADLLAASADNKDKESVSREDLLDERDVCVRALGWAHVGGYLTKWTRFLKKDYYEPF